MLNIFEEDLNKSSKFKSKLSILAYTNGRQANIDDTIALLANIDTFLHFTLEFDPEDLPLTIVVI